MILAEGAAVLLAGVAAGAINAVVGSGTLVTFPVLVALGYPPVVATMSNAIGLIPGDVSGAWMYRRELRGQGRRLLRLAPASLLGALGGAWLLLRLPDDAFRTIVPVLIVLALLLVVTQPRIQRAVALRRAARGPGSTEPTGAGMVALLVLVLLAGVYGGYFAAAQGIVLIGLLGMFVHDHLQRLNGLKIVLAGIVDVVAATAYTIVAFHRIEWAAVGLISVGTLIGGVLGGRYGRRLPPPVLRGLIVALGLVAVWRITAT